MNLEKNEGCEFQKVGSDGYPFCASATEIMRLRDVLESYAKTFDGWAAENNGGGRQMDGQDWLELANELRMERDGEMISSWPYDAIGGKAIRELGYEPVEEGDSDGAD